jgi:hypothetical protein
MIERQALRDPCHNESLCEANNELSICDILVNCGCFFQPGCATTVESDANGDRRALR